MFDVIGFSETNLADDIQQLFTLPSYHTRFTYLSGSSGGGNLVIHNRFPSHFWTDLSFQEDCPESVFVEISSNTTNVLVGQLYRRPKGSPSQLLEKIQMINTFDYWKLVIGTYLDLSKAFDAVTHIILLSRLERSGIRCSYMIYIKLHKSKAV